MRNVVVGVQQLVRGGVDLLARRNLVIVSVVMVCGVGGKSVQIGLWSLQGLGLAALLGVMLNLDLPLERSAG